ncbi:MAG: DUF4112 domain-containing protein [Longimicrobiales bacterium]|nr:DUF4112 domain-containing protein [Longimicrobiales bacterium]
MRAPSTDPTPPSHTPAPLRRARRVAHLLDDLVRIPGTRLRVGLDPLLGVVPGLGDWVSWILSGHLLWCGWRLRVSASTLTRMMGNLVVDAAVGLVPLLGDAFDVVWRANDRNLRILERHVADPEGLRRESRALATAVLVAGAGLMAAAGWAAWTVFGAVLSVLGVS